VAEALALVGLPVVHVVTALPAYAGPAAGNSRAPDDKIAEWCAQTEHVLITTDQEFQGRWIRSGMLAKHGAEVIVFDRQLVGLQEQHRRVTIQLPIWQAELGKQAYAHRVWEQSHRQLPMLRIGKKLRPRTRVAKTKKTAAKP
jgi:hypothetical protein